MKWLISFLMVYSSLLSDVIAVASDGESLKSNISSQASRCNYYIFIDERGKILEIIQNPHKDVKGGASSKLVEMLKSKKASNIIASDFGEKLTISLEDNGIKYTFYKGNIKKYIQSELIKTKK
ncbi:MAG: NifB/NifX family molybdenum-iron cluster-binding protein [Campylobacterota bacterium]|nr:NifB/NifX family molybdenum-iron cluster-binding protein [Campylobacterota bacterium]